MVNGYWVLWSYSLSLHDTNPVTLEEMLKAPVSVNNKTSKRNIETLFSSRTICSKRQGITTNLFSFQFEKLASKSDPINLKRRLIKKNNLKTKQLVTWTC